MCIHDTCTEVRKKLLKYNTVQASNVVNDLKLSMDNYSILYIMYQFTAITAYCLQLLIHCHSCIRNANTDPIHIYKNSEVFLDVQIPFNQFLWPISNTCYENAYHFHCFNWYNEDIQLWQVQMKPPVHSSANLLQSFQLHWQTSKHT